MITFIPFESIVLCEAAVYHILELFHWYLLKEYMWLHMVLVLCWDYNIIALFVCCVRRTVTAVISIQVRMHFCTKKSRAVLTPHIFESLQWAGISKSEEDIIGCMGVDCCVQDAVCYNALDYSCLREEACLTHKSYCKFFAICYEKENIQCI